ncbi:LOW QUALITY PROTEIN: inactive ubiquitin carboxyl-terminal hydrolase MINDY-4B [Daphnia magna]|uniref:LOW QUALITY PROTEIN: inactive ubiquitin carboxyl-terminal hydrolase MINDY-4B n=1 Tax=Daphnia magna TaxID=35525 RepID=UPI001E1BDB71|nr:LOW QUALITY PROTEIN: inactive ubiquitin carboxyl-terminal hydrolase MINDY-4B [Daphnia magna]
MNIELEELPIFPRNANENARGERKESRTENGMACLLPVLSARRCDRRESCVEKGVSHILEKVPPAPSANRVERKESRLENGTPNITGSVSPLHSRVFGMRERASRQLQNTASVNGSKPITEPIAVALRRIVFGQCPAPIKAEYFSRGPGLVFREAERDLGYALMVSHAAGLPIANSLMMALQTHILRILLFDVRPSRVYQPDPLKPSFSMQQEALCTAITDIIWTAGGCHYGVLCLPHPIHIHVEESDHFNADGVTEKLNILECQDREELQYFVRRNLFLFQQDPGPALLLLIYSAVLARGIDRIAEDMGTRWITGTNSYLSSLINYSGDISFSALNLILSGRAASYLHNGTHFQEDKDKIMIAQHGIQARSPIGLLLWMRTEEKTAAYKLGSRLKTPVYPIWLIIASEQSGVLFSDDRDLLRDYRSEIRFELHYHTSSHNQLTPAVLVIRTKLPLEVPEEDVALPTLDKIIRTKWSGARVSWNGLTPFL